jgi:uncharacterized membrane protein
MTLYLSVKLVHVIGATVLFGTGIGTAFFMLKAYLSRNEQAMTVVTRSVVLADWVFTTPAVVVQAMSGLWLAHRLGIAFDSAWFVTVVLLYAFVGACWIPVIWVQIRIRNLIAAGACRDDYRGLMRIWVALGVPAFGAVLVLFFLMVFRIGAHN